MLIINKQLDPTQLRAVTHLANLCQEVDGTALPLYPHILEQKRLTDSNVLFFQDDNLLGFLSVYFFYVNACEISVLVAPAYRRQGIAKQLIQSIMPLLLTKQVDTLLFSTPAKINAHWLSQLGFIYHNCEYQMQRHSYEPILSTKQQLKIRKATEKDIPTLCSIDTLCFPEEQDDMPVRFHNLLHENNYSILLAFHQQQAIGKAHIRWQTDRAIISDIAIVPPSQGQGLGSELLCYCINQALSLGITKLILDVETSNLNALNLYLRHDFKTVNATEFWAISTDKLHNLLKTC